MRLFVSLDLPEEIFHFLRDVQALMPHQGIAAAQHFHLTLFFLGNIEDEQLEQVKEALKAVAAEGFELTMDELGMFKNKHGDPRVIWVGIEENEALLRLQKQVAEKMVALGYEEDKEFVPHLTLARVKESGTGIEKDFDSIFFKKRSFPVESFSLMESELKEDGAYYTPMEVYKLGE